MVYDWFHHISLYSTARPSPQKKMVEKDQTICHFLWLDLIFNAK